MLVVTQWTHHYRPTEKERTETSADLNNIYWFRSKFTDLEVNSKVGQKAS